MLNGELRDIS